MPVRPLTDEEEFVLDAAFGRVEAARRAVDQARRELGTVMRGVGLSASARHLKRSRQWALQVAQEAEAPRAPSEERASTGDDLADSVRRLGIVEPIVVEALDDEFLRVLDGHRRLRIARDAGMTSIPVSLMLRRPEQDERFHRGSSDAARTTEEAPSVRSANVDAATAASRDHRRVRFLYKGLEREAGVRTVDAWGVVWRSGIPYLVGFDQDRAAIRTFRIDRVLDDVEDVGEGSPAPEGFSAERNVWSQLDPEIAEAMHAMFRTVFQEVVRGRALEDWVELAGDLRRPVDD